MTAIVQSGELPVQTEVPRMREQPRFSATLDLVALPTAVSVARIFIADTLRRWQALFIEEHMETVAAELVALSVQSTSPDEDTSWTDITEINPITLRLLGYARHIVFEVTDAHDGALAVPEGAPLPEDKGIGLVDALANRWGSFVGPRGRVIWAELSVYERTKAGLPKRDRKPSPYPRDSKRPPATEEELELLQRIRDGLEKW